MNSIADVLITRGWTQGRYEDDDGSVCLSGAARVASNGKARGCAIPSHVAWVLRRTAACGHIPTWNDTLGRTFEEVLRVAKLADEVLEGYDPPG